MIERAALDDLVDKLAALSPAERRRVPGIKPARGDIVLAGAIVIQSVLEAGGFPGIEATEAGLREGIFFERLLADARRPLIDDVRRASVLNLAAQYDTTPAHTRHVARLALRSSTSSPPRAFTRATPRSASCSRPPRCSTTSAWRSTTTTTTSTRAT